MRLCTLPALLLALSSVRADDYACMDHGYARMPCHDELQLVGADKLLLTLAGHSCYSLAVAAPQPLEVYLYDTVALDVQPQRPTNASVLALGDAEPLVLDPHVCHTTPRCSEVREGLSPSTVYSLVIARSRGAAEPLDEAAQLRVVLDLQHCDPLSASHYLGLLAVGALGFTSVLLLLCLVGEFLLGFRSVAKLRKSVESIQFVELTQVEHMTKVTVVDGSEEEAALIESTGDGPRTPTASNSSGEGSADDAEADESQPLATDV